VSASSNAFGTKHAHTDLDPKGARTRWDGQRLDHYQTWSPATSPWRGVSISDLGTVLIHQQYADPTHATTRPAARGQGGHVAATIALNRRTLSETSGCHCTASLNGPSGSSTASRVWSDGSLALAAPHAPYGPRGVGAPERELRRKRVPLLTILPNVCYNYSHQTLSVLVGSENRPETQEDLLLRNISRRMRTRLLTLALPPALAASLAAAPAATAATPAKRPPNMDAAHCIEYDRYQITGRAADSLVQLSPTVQLFNASYTQTSTLNASVTATGSTTLALSSSIGVDVSVIVATVKSSVSPSVSFSMSVSQTFGASMPVRPRQVGYAKAGIFRVVTTGTYSWRNDDCSGGSHATTAYTPYHPGYVTWGG
jgi:hypothetical protein